MRDWAREIEDDLKWREAELASFKVLVTEAANGSVRQVALLRAMWAMLYAHYEGFSKFAWDLYLEALEEQGLDRKQFKEPIARLSLLKEFKEFRANLSHKSIWQFCQSGFSSLLDQKLKFTLKLETDSNLWPNLFRENSASANLPYDMLDKHETKIRALVQRRNEIAHGQKMVISTLSEYQQYEDAAILVMHELGLSVVECLDAKTFLAP